MLGVLTAAAVLGRWQLATLAASRAVRKAEAPPTSVRVTTLEPESVAPGVHYSAVVKELQKAELSFRVGGTLESLHQVKGADGRVRNVHEGDRVAGETVLAHLDPADYKRDRGAAAEKLASAEARLAQANAEAELAKVEFGRTEQLVRRGSTTQSELDTNRTKLLSTTAVAAGARRDVESARIALEQAEANLGYTTLTAPFREATVAARYVEPGERVAANQKAFLILDLSSVVIAFGVPDTLVGKLAIGQTVEATCDALPGERFEAVVHKIGSTSDPQTRTYAVEVRIDDPRGLRPGMVATAHFRREQTACLLPLTALAPRGGNAGYDVFRVVDEGGRTVVRKVPVGFDDVVDNRVVVKVGEPGGLNAGDRVVATGTHRLYDGLPVQVVE